MTTIELTLESAPRSAEELKKLSKAARCRLHELLQTEYEDLEPNHRTFRQLTADAQSQVLADMLKEMDEEDERSKDDRFVVIGAALPLRKKDDNENQKRWDVFSRAIQETMNQLQRDGVNPQIVRFEGHGVFIIGERVQQQAGPGLIGLPIPLSSLLSPIIAEKVREEAERGNQEEAKALGQIITKIQSMHTPFSSKDDFRKVAADVLPSIEDKVAFEKFVRDEYEKHAKECIAEGDCILDKILGAVLEACEDHKKNLC